MKATGLGGDNESRCGAGEMNEAAVNRREHSEIRKLLIQQV